MQPKEHYIVGVDHGYSYMKTAHDSFPTVYVDKSSVPSGLPENLSYEGKYYSLRTYTKNSIPFDLDKSSNDLFWILTLFALARELMIREPGKKSIEADISLCIGLPRSAYNQASKKAWEEYFIKRWDNTLMFSYDDVDFLLTLKDVECYVQGFSIFISKLAELKLFSKRVLLVDIGGYTVDLVGANLFNNKVSDQIISSISDSGINILLTRISDTYMNLYREKMDFQLISNILKYPEEFSYMSSEKIKLITDLATEFSIEILRNVEKSLIDPLSSYGIYFCGGGSSLLRPYLIKALEDEGVGNTKSYRFLPSPSQNAIAFEELYQLKH